MDLNLNISFSSFVITNVLMIVLSLFNLKVLIKKNNLTNSKDVDLKYYEKSYFYKGGNYIYDSIISVLVSLFSRNKIDISRKDYKARNGEMKTSYEIKKIDNSGIDDFEEKLLDTLFSFSDGEVISTRALNNTRKTSPDDYNKPFNELIYYLEGRMKDYGLISREKSTSKSVLSFVIFSFLFLIGAVTVYNGHYFGAISIILSIILYGFLIASFSKMTDSGKKKLRKLESLEESLKKLDLKVDNPTLVAIGFGLKYENIKEIYKKSSENGMGIFFEDDKLFYDTFKTALVGNFLLTRN
ncbi:DUF2207 domain-containing protein [Peptoniphilus sp. MSJ-1]|uniref:DUF2207 domain-containing protein n=1 Tax=Peptoniphilus ovalis TaxID=2841503 RepID=A0ABS6FDV3_9FIRM|nr:DUF2207 domain-containing protein [Peptoniphilus ovalis]MBU5668339.1 DUF2207 domain-containing protein [Peptoniphilus ovalis]